MSVDEGKSTALHPSHPIDPNMIQYRAPKKSVRQARSKIALEKAKKWMLESMSGDHYAAPNEHSDDCAEEDKTIKRKSQPTSDDGPLRTSHSTMRHEAGDMSTDLIPNPAKLHHHPPLQHHRTPTHLTLTILEVLMIQSFTHHSLIHKAKHRPVSHQLCPCSPFPHLGDLHLPLCLASRMCYASHLLRRVIKFIDILVQ